MSAGADGAVGLVIEEPVDRFEVPCAFVLGHKRIVEGQKQRPGEKLRGA